MKLGKGLGEKNLTFADEGLTVPVASNGFYSREYTFKGWMMSVNLKVWILRYFKDLTYSQSHLCR